MTRMTTRTAVLLFSALLWPVASVAAGGGGGQAQSEKVESPQSKGLAPETLKMLDLQVAPGKAHTAVTDQLPAAAIQTHLGPALEAQAGEGAGAERRLELDLTAIRDRVGSVKDISVWGDGKSATAVADALERVSLVPGQLLAVRRQQPPAIATSDRGETVTSSPTVLYLVDRSGRARELALVHRTVGLHWLADQARFAGDLLIGLVDRENDQAAEPLENPIPVQLLGPRDSVEPTVLSIDHIGVPYQTATVEVEDPGDPFTVELNTQVDPDLPPVELTVHRPRLVISAPAELQGFGVEQAEVTVTSESGRLRPEQTITLDLDRGWLEKRALVVDDRGVASTRIRSAGLGTGTLSLGPGLYRAEARTIAFVPPWRWLFATLLGGALGSTVFVYRLKKEKPRQRRHVMDWIVGLIIGFGATTMAYAGMRLPQWVPVPDLLVGEVVPFALSFICAAAGLALIHAITGGPAKSNAQA